MTPQIVSFDGGAHNANLPETTSRLLRGGSWKKQRVVSIIPAGELIPAKVYLSHVSLMFPPNQAAHRMLAQGMEVGEAYSQTIESILAHPDLSQFEFLLTIEHDNCPPPDGMIRLIARMEEHPEFAAVSGLYFTKGPGGCAQIWGDPNDTLNFRPQVPKQGELVECCGIGMGFAVWRMSLFKDARLRRPWFKTQADANGMGTQDLYFSSDARKYGYRFAVDCDVLVGHYDYPGSYGAPDTMW